MRFIVKPRDIRFSNDKQREWLLFIGTFNVAEPDACASESALLTIFTVTRSMFEKCTNLHRNWRCQLLKCHPG
jgi:hypothetical protein